MSHKRIKNIVLDDDYDSYEEDYCGAGDSLTPEDKEQLRIGTTAVRKALDSNNAVTDEEIQDSLWHYYYDIDKTVTYLKSELLS